MDASVSVYGANVETTGPATKRSPRSRRRRGWSGPPSVLLAMLRYVPSHFVKAYKSWHVHLFMYLKSTGYDENGEVS